MRRRGLFARLSALPLILLLGLSAPHALAAPSHAIAMHGAPKYGPEFTHFDYVNPEAPKGGTLKLAWVGSYDSLNPFIIKGRPAIGLGLVYDTLMVASSDEPFSHYGLVAESVETPNDRSWAIFRLNPKARFHDGHPITAEDVLFSFDILRTEGAPLYRFYYADVSEAVALDDHTVKFTFSTNRNRELPLVLGQLPVLPKHAWEDRTFSDTTLEPPVGSGPYRVAAFEPGRYIRYERVKDYWGADLPVMVGMYNFDAIQYDYYRDFTVAVEALKAGEYDFRSENIAKNWATAYEGENKNKGLLIQHAFKHSRVAPTQGYVMNMRRPPFNDPAVREALAYAFDFAWANQNLFYDAYARTRSNFDNSELAATGVPEGDELALLEPYRDQLPPRLFTEEYNPPSVPAPGEIRQNLRTALTILNKAGWEMKDGVMTQTERGDTLRFQILLDNPSLERVTLPYVQNLKRLGADVDVRVVDTAQYTNRINSFDFDMIAEIWAQSDSPGNEQREFWSRDTANVEGSRNLTGVSSPVVDALIDDIVRADSREDLVTAVHALDRVLQWTFYLVPMYHSEADRFVYWNRFGMPEITPDSGASVMTWWIDPEKDAALRAAGVLTDR
ncbi:ABC transporter substrate-binding protein [Roseospira marina]|uniref:ABC transporter substrate-binding protein n=1 Tax=Roseospira marina TaxID=140057 RepID=A0A5M6IEM5_9PROT|nr:extracellular solute-binding protein [Roseospira marina]KAA5605998.1 ABC transporter substrate-binding protein [Roseospira marina]MBB4313149.1 microcin C transport system substrate-binding protein [Roseospira marina]MBB5086110.1 microcin C transport system substrate-binding protein [Roseospira marina]